MTVSVLIPWKPGCPYRQRAWAWVQARYAAAHPDWQIVTGTTEVPGFSRTQAILDAAERADGDVLVVADADVWCDEIPAAVAAAVDEHGWAIPHRLLHRLSRDSTDRVLAGEDWRGLALSTDNRQDSRPYLGHETDTLCVFQRDVLLAVPPDPRFVGWGQEGDAWALTLRGLIGRPWRGSADLVHLWHPPQPRESRTVGSRANLALHRRYINAGRNQARLRALLEETAPWPTPTSASS